MHQFDDIVKTFIPFVFWQAVVVGFAMTALFTWYLLASRRVNATFRHRLRSDEA